VLELARELPGLVHLLAEQRLELLLGRLLGRRHRLLLLAVPRVEGRRRRARLLARGD